MNRPKTAPCSMILASAKGEKYALVFGNEVNGVSDEVMKNVDACIEIPQFGTKHSFNIVVSAGIVLWDLFSKMDNLIYEISSWFTSS